MQEQVGYTETDKIKNKIKYENRYHNVQIERTNWETTTLAIGPNTLSDVSEDKCDEGIESKRELNNVRNKTTSKTLHEKSSKIPCLVSSTVYTKSCPIPRQLCKTSDRIKSWCNLPDLATRLAHN